jgi:hypothetical protein
MECDVVWLVRTDVWDECIASIIGVKRITELGKTLAVVLQFLVSANVIPRSLIFF